MGVQRARAHRVIAGKLCSIDDGIATNVGCDAPPQTGKSLFPAHELPGIQTGYMM